jgi:hypothetical protein
VFVPLWSHFACSKNENKSSVLLMFGVCARGEITPLHYSRLVKSTFCEARPRKQLIKSVPPSADITQQKFRSPHGPRRAFRRFEEKLSFENPYTDLEIQISQSRPADKNVIIVWDTKPTTNTRARSFLVLKCKTYARQ